MVHIAENEKVPEFESTESKYPLLPKDVKDNFCTKACLDEVKHNRNHYFVVNDRL